jgi:hypothetical protein
VGDFGGSRIFGKRYFDGFSAGTTTPVVVGGADELKRPAAGFLA